jgi:hypothetical protein
MVLVESHGSHVALICPSGDVWQHYGQKREEKQERHNSGTSMVKSLAVLQAKLIKAVKLSSLLNMRQ